MEGVGTNNNNNKKKSESDQILNEFGSENENNNIDFSSTTSPESSKPSVAYSRIKKLIYGVHGKKKRKTATSTSEHNYEGALVPLNHNQACLLTNSIDRTIVTVVLVEAIGLPVPRDVSSVHNLYCKLKLGSKTYTSKGMRNTGQAKWGQRFDFRSNHNKTLKLSLWSKGKYKNFMGSTVLDISNLEINRTVQVWKKLENGSGKIHFSITLCDVRKHASTNEENNLQQGIEFAKNTIINLKSDWNLVGKVCVEVIGAKGLCGSHNAYCTLELDNQRVQTHSLHSSEPTWNKSYLFDVHDVTSTLDINVYGSTVWNALQIGSLGRVSIPLLDITNGETRCIGLKDISNRRSAKGDYPRVQLKMRMIWNPVKATAKLFRPKEEKHTKKPPKFNLPLVYSNMKFIRDTFVALFELNEQIKRLFEWDNQELSLTILIGWLIFWYNFRMWATPLLLLLPFFYFWITHSSQPEDRYYITGPYRPVIDDNSESNNDTKSDITKTLIEVVSDPGEMKEMSLTITRGVEYLVSLAERLFNLASFKVPFLSILAMIFLLISAFALYFIPFNYMMMAFGIYKFTRKYLNPERTLNNDLLDFLSRVPDNEMLKDWKVV